MLIVASGGLGAAAALVFSAVSSSSQQVHQVSAISASDLDDVDLITAMSSNPAVETSMPAIEVRALSQTVTVALSDVSGIPTLEESQAAQTLLRDEASEPVFSQQQEEEIVPEQVAALDQGLGAPNAPETQTDIQASAPVELESVEFSEEEILLQSFRTADLERSEQNPQHESEPIQLASTSNLPSGRHLTCLLYTSDAADD